MSRGASVDRDFGHMDQDRMETLDTENRYTPLAERVGNVNIADNNPSKRKRHETGSVDLSTFEKMTNDERQFAMFTKLAAIESSQNEMRAMQSRVNQTCNRLDKTVNHVDVNTFRTHLLAYKYLDLETKQRSCNVIVYGLEELEHDGVRISTILRNFFHDFLLLEEDDLYIIHAKRIGQTDTRGRRVQKRPILCTFSHYSEVDMVMGEAKRLKNTPHAVDRDYPPEIATARKRLWPEVKRLRSLAGSTDNIQLKYPAKIVKNGQTVQDAFPYWDTLIKASVCGEFRYITQDEQLLPATSLPGVPGIQSMPMNVNVPLAPSETDTTRNISHSTLRMPSPFQMPLMPPPPPPVPRQSLFMNGQNVNMRTTIQQTNMPTSLGSWQSPRPQRPVVTVSYMEEQSNLPGDASQVDASQPSSPSILSQSFHSNSASSNPTQNNPEQNSKQNQVPQNIKQHVSRPVSHSLDATRDRSESMGRHDSRGKPRNVNNRGRSRSVKPRDKKTTTTTGVARTQQNSQTNNQTSSVSEQTQTQNNV